MTEEKIKVFVYGTLRTGQGNWKRLLENNPNAEKICDDEIRGFIMYHLGGFPAIVPVENFQEYNEILNNPDSHSLVTLEEVSEILLSNEIIGEVFEVDSYTLQRLDSLEGYRKNGNGLYNRMEVETEKGHPALVYFMNEEPSWKRSLIESGDWLNK
jgi:gamma-glutamylcyclotransferase (GGCT)/AIG2-like uncharacterized protein YtfP